MRRHCRSSLSRLDVVGCGREVAERVKKTTSVPKTKKKDELSLKLLDDPKIPTARRKPRRRHHSHKHLDVAAEMGLKTGRPYCTRRHHHHLSAAPTNFDPTNGGLNPQNRGWSPPADKGRDPLHPHGMKAIEVGQIGGGAGRRRGRPRFCWLQSLVTASTKLWCIIEEGYSPRDPKKLTRRDVVDDQLNATAINMIHMAVTPKDRTHIRSLKTAKEAWDKLDKLFLGNASIQSSRFDEVNNMADNFVMIEGETPEEMYRRSRRTNARSWSNVRG
ncbi:hypothetical protein QYE76_031068 [Lolium multiflorum]|uniref:Uncharacterized protein n=1 Tax=Lolium multiflorum TaxID=4521 RepID=A0AAD8QR11_LOLMU|nr:hypothetical protein QYE76_031068 [Lolium multiflorum]